MSDALTLEVRSLGRDELQYFRPAILTAAAEAYAEPQRSSEWFDWKYLQSPFGSAHVAVALTREETVAGLVSFGSYQVTRGAEVASAAVSYDTFVVPSFRGAGLFKRLLREAESSAARAGVDVLFNFPNPNSLPGFLSSQFHDHGRLRSWIRLSPGLAIAQAVRPKESRDGRVLPVGFIPSHGSMKPWTSRLPFGPVRRIHSQPFLDWRFAGTRGPGAYAFFELDGVGVLGRTVSRGRAREFQALEFFEERVEDRKAVARLLRSATNAVGAGLCTVLVSPEHPVVPLLSGPGFMQVRNRTSFCVKALTSLGETYASSPWVIQGSDIHTW